MTRLFYSRLSIAFGLGVPFKQVHLRPVEPLTSEPANDAQWNMVAEDREKDLRRVPPERIIQTFTQHRRFALPPEFLGMRLQCVLRA